ncbi:MAG: YihY family inner membrane protein [Verrucomicrobia bacterium]|nr:YihY family inner membrane protein [Verrucomicrobiota bacterium]
MISKWLRYLDRDLWNFNLSQKSGFERFRLKWLRVFYLSVRGFVQDQCTLRASSLTYYTLISIVPVLAMILAVAGGFGYREAIRDELLTKFHDQKEAFLQIIEFADQLLAQTKGGLIAGVGLVVLFWSVTALLNNMEIALNHIWGIHKMRPWRRILSDYFALMLIAPFFFLLSSSATVFIANRLENLVHFMPIGNFFIHLVPYALFWILFTFIFVFMPNTRVRFRSAFVGGLVTGTLYMIVQWGYIFFQIGVSRYGAVYGSFAALPLFLIWIQLSWFLVLFGAEVSYAHQTLETHEFGEIAEKMSYSLRRLLCLWVSYLVVHKFVKSGGPLSQEILVKRHQIPHGVLNRIAQELIDCGILLEVKGDKELIAYAPARSPDDLRISDVCEALDSKGTRDWPWIESKAWKQLEAALEGFQDKIRNDPDNKRLKDYENE